MRVQDFNGATQAVAQNVAQTIVWTASQLPGSVPGAVVEAFHFSLDGHSSFDVSTISRIRVKSGGVTFYDFPAPAVLRVLQELAYIHATPNGTTNNAFTIPFYLGGMNEEDQDLSGFPLFSIPTVEITLTSPNQAGLSMTAGWTISDTKVSPYYPVVLSQPMAIGSTSAISSQRFYFSEPGYVRAIGIETTTAQFTRARVVINGQQKCNLSNTLLTESQKYRLALLTDITNPRTYKITGMTDAQQGSSYLELDLAANFPPGNAATIFALRPQAGQSQGS